MRNKKLANLVAIRKPDTFISSTIPAIDILFSGRINNSGIKKGEGQIFLCSGSVNSKQDVQASRKEQIQIYSYRRDNQGIYGNPF